MATSGVFSDYSFHRPGRQSLSSVADSTSSENTAEGEPSSLVDQNDAPGRRGGLNAVSLDDEGLGSSMWEMERDAGAMRCAHMLLFAIASVTENKRELNVTIRAGLHRGKVLSGIVGQVAAQFDIFGHDANYSARLEQHCVLGCVHVSEVFYDGAAVLLPSTLAELHSERQSHDFKNIGLVTTVMLTPPPDEIMPTKRADGSELTYLADWLKRARVEMRSVILRRSLQRASS